MTWSQYYRHYVSQLQTIYSADEAALITGWMFDKAGISKTQRLNTPDHIMGQNELQQLALDLAALLQHRPAQYVLGATWFYNLRIR